MGMPTIPQQAKLPADAVAYGSIGAVLLDTLPTALAIIASLLSIVWIGLQIWSWFEARRKK